jgi:S1-C subfamily serine protease
VQSCIHCHQVRDAERVYYRSQGKEIPEQVLFPYPLPEVIGLTMDPNECATVKSVEKGSLAAKILSAGDRITHINGQPIVSTADIQWILHNAGDGSTLSFTVSTEKYSIVEDITLPNGWKRKSNLSWRPTTWDLRRLGAGGLLLEDLSDDQRKERGIESDALALKVKHVGQYGEHAVAKNAGFQKDDVIVQVGQAEGRWSETDFLAAALEHPRGTKLDVTVLRGEKRVELKLPLQ